MKKLLIICAFFAIIATACETSVVVETPVEEAVVCDSNTTTEVVVEPIDSLDHE